MTDKPAPTTLVKLAVMSDLHCRLRTDANDSMLVVGDCRKPVTQHPVQSLLDLINREQTLASADFLLIPGDLANKARLEGLSQGWDFALEVGQALKCQRIFPVLGNHDIESRRADATITRDPMYNPRNLRPGFPFFEEALCQQFFSEGFCIVEPNPSIRFVLINSVIDHLDSLSAERGSFGEDRINRLRLALEPRPKVAICVAMLHHHPVLHSGLFVQDVDVIQTGDSLMRALRQGACSLVIHGHKHMARLRREDATYVFAAGSLGALLNAQGTSMGNMFHLIELRADSLGDRVKGCIRTWTFQLGTGWIPSNLRYKGFPHVTGFGRAATIEQMGGALKALSDSRPDARYFTEDEVLQVASDLLYSTPDDYELLNKRLADHKLKLSDYDDSRLGLGRMG
jgi:predicted phosphodiesterase